MSTIKLKTAKADKNRVARTVAAALKRAKPRGPNIEAYSAWVTSCRELADVFCWSPGSITLQEFYSLCELEL